MTVKQRWGKTSLHNKALVVIGCFAALGTIFYAGAAAWQVCIMRDAARDSSAQIERLTNATNLAIKKAVDASAAETKDAIKSNTEAVNAALAKNREMINAQMAQSKKALDASIDASRNDQRAWIVVSTMTSDPPELTVGKPLFIDVGFKNAGRSAALKVAVVEKAETFDSPMQAPAFSYEGISAGEFGVVSRKHTRSKGICHDGSFAAKDTNRNGPSGVLHDAKGRTSDSRDC
jgi:hypothetical protein